jgi:hypothetical protein
MNPDWVGYLTIFNDNGSWLAEQDRDAGFLILITFFKSLFGANSYLLFRQILNLYFAGIVFFLARGKIIEFSENRSKLFYIFLAIIPLVVVRFPIQIREGIALTLILFGLRFFFKNVWDNDVASHRKRNTAFVILFFTLSALVHSGTGVFLALYLASMFFSFAKRTSKHAYGIGYTFFKVIIFSAAFIVPLYYSFAIGSFINEFGLYVQDNATLNGSKLAYWIFYGVIVFFVRREMLKYSRTIQPQTQRVFIELIGGTILITNYTFCFVSILLQFPATFVSVLLRTLNLLICISLFLLAIHHKNNKVVWVTSLFLIVDQFRVLNESISGLEY